MSDNLPPLPEPLIMSMVASSRDLRYTADQLRAYGQQCRAQALEEAALRFERVGGMIDPRSIAAAIRTLKDKP